MLSQLANDYSMQIQTFLYLITLINALLHVIFAGAVARDSGRLYRVGHQTALVSGATWAFATLIGGVFIASVYWFIHHSNLTRPPMQATNPQN